MTDAIVQLGIAAFGLTALWMAMGNHVAMRRWAPIVGLIGQVFWAVFAWQTQAAGLAVLVVAYTAVYVQGARVQWRSGRFEAAEGTTASSGPDGKEKSA